MKKFGKACGIDVGAAAVAILNEPVFVEFNLQDYFYPKMNHLDMWVTKTRKGGKEMPTINQLVRKPRKAASRNIRFTSS